MGINRCSVCGDEWLTANFEDNICNLCGKLGYTIKSKSNMEVNGYGRLVTKEYVKENPAESFKYVKVGNSFRFFVGEYKHIEAVSKTEIEKVKAGGYFFFGIEYLMITESYSSTLNVSTSQEDEEEIAKLFGVALRTEF